jgi:hypothetical protein
MVFIVTRMHVPLTAARRNMRSSARRKERLSQFDTLSGLPEI